MTTILCDQDDRLREMIVRFAESLKTEAHRLDTQGSTIGIAHTLRGTGHDASEDGTVRGVPLVPVLARALKAKANSDHREDGETYVPVIPLALRNARRSPKRDATNRQGVGIGEDGDPAMTITRGAVPGVAVSAIAIQDARPGKKHQNGKGWSDDGAAYTLDQGSTPAVAIIPFDTTQITHADNRSNPQPGDPCHPLASTAHVPAIAFTMKDHGGDAGDISPTLRAGGHAKSHANGGVYPGVTTPTMGVRRLTPREMERLQGFPDDHTAIPWRGKPASECPDRPRAKALGNSFAVPVVRWIGERILKVDALARQDGSP